MLTAMGNALLLVVLATPCSAQSLSPKWEDLTASDFVKALQTSKATCALPFGFIEKHGPAGPLGTDLINVRYTTTLAANQEYTIIFPEYYFGQIAEARHPPDLARVRLPEDVSTSIAWYARFSNHYQGDSAGSNALRGDAATNAIAQRLADAFRAIKADDVSPRLQKEFFEKSSRPVETKQ